MGWVNLEAGSGGRHAANAELSGDRITSQPHHRQQTSSPLVNLTIINQP